MEVGDARASTSPMAPALARRGYVEEEHVLGGHADLYGYRDGETVQVEADLPFTTRLLVRRPLDPGPDASTVVLEALHPAGDMPSAWPRTGRAITRAGWTWVGVTQDLAGLAATKASDPDRYRELEIPKVGMGYDIVSQVARMLRGPGSPVAVDHMIMTGASYTGTFQRVFLGDGFHDRTRQADGAPAIEGYLIQISSGSFGLGGYNVMNPDDPAPPVGDRRRTIGAHDVPVIELLSEGEAETNLGARRDDSDAAGDRYRLWEVPGACHMSSAERGHGPLAPTVEEPSDFPMWAIAGRALHHLLAWTVEGVAPPRAERVVHLRSKDAGPCGSAPEALPLQRDEHGNAIGGVRTPFVDVPVASYYPHSTIAVEGGTRAGPPGRPRIDMGDIMGSMTRFPPDVLRRLYGSPAGYRKRFEESLAAAVDAGWYDPADAPTLLDMATAVDF